MASPQKNGKEHLLREITDKIRSSLDIEETLAFICQEIAKLFGVERASIVMYPKEDNWKTIIVKHEYKVSEKFEGFDKMTSYPLLRQCWDMLLTNEEGISAIDNIKNSSTPDFFKQTYEAIGVKSILGLVIKIDNDIKGCLVLSEYDNYRHWTEEEKELLKLISNQIYLAIQQAEIYEKEKSEKLRESLLRKIFETIRSTLDVNTVKNTIVNEAGKVLSADISFIMNYNLEEDFFYVDEGSEYRSSLEEKSFIDGMMDDPFIDYFNDLLKSKKEIHYTNLDEFLEENNLVNSSLSAFQKNYNLKSSYNFPIFYQDVLFGYLVVMYTKDYRILDEDEMSLLRIISNQAGVALNQAKMYKEAEENAKKEALLREITEKIRQSLNIKDTLRFICEEMTKVFNVERTIITFFSGVGKYHKIVLREEYTINPDIKGCSDIKDYFKIAAYWEDELIKTGEILAFENISESNAPEYFKQNYESLGVKSAMGISIGDIQGMSGALVLSDYNQYRKWTKDEKMLFKTISNQIYIAINRSQLYEREKLLFKEERVCRSMVEILRSSMDKDVIKQLFVKNISKFFKANRVFFSEYDESLNEYLPIDKNSEYLSDISEKSYVGYDWSNPGIIEYIRPLLGIREIRIPDVEDYVEKCNCIPKKVMDLYKVSNVKSSYSFPVMHQDKLQGFLGIDYTDKIHILSDEDIERIRSICIQAGVALYHSKEYLRAHDELITKKKFIKDIAQRVGDILKQIKILSKIIRSTTAASTSNDSIQCITDIEKNIKYILNLSEFEYINESDNEPNK